MKKEIAEIKKLLKEHESLMKTMNLYKKYLDNDYGEALKIEDMDTYMLARKIQEQGKVKEYEKLADKAKNDSINLIKENFFELEYGLGSEFVDRCMSNVVAGDIEQVQIDLRKREENIKTKTIRTGLNSINYFEETELLEAERKSPITTRLFGIRKEVYNPRLSSCKPTVKEDIRDINKTLEKLEELNSVSNLYRKYINSMITGEEITVEDFEVYEIANEVFRGGKNTIEKFEEYTEERKNAYISSLKDQLKSVESRFDPKFIRKCIKNIEEGNVERVKETFSKMQDNIKEKKIKRKKDCLTLAEEKLYKEAMKKTPIKTKLFGIKVEVIDNKKQEIELASRKRMDVKKVYVNTPSIDRNNNINLKSNDSKLRC